ncbi:hypothetical protein ADLECEL_13000 [Adlercreutzia equolifaciens subsp. celatus]|nr:hypothetical protein ADLECEL_13000 [Adlercreutzia equolifaciens subsp. celatus]
MWFLVHRHASLCVWPWVALLHSGTQISVTSSVESTALPVPWDSFSTTPALMTASPISKEESLPTVMRQPLPGSPM